MKYEVLRFIMEYITVSMIIFIVLSVIFLGITDRLYTILVLQKNKRNGKKENYYQKIRSIFRKIFK